ncbi:glycosyltransferase family 2 protein [uncultured Marinobacter sp.]|uniref:glycosyltransferase family 2 protein n=1 Tax=uncultured Marinobacter sp. TaxID=187379 RepID=UPI0026245727|nr:glycosyltransferase family 2 protein [uncultured Marinobacter sp.]
MATTPYFVIGPSTLLSFIGLLRGPDKTPPESAEDPTNAKVDVVIPALNEEQNILLALSSIARQTLQPRKIILVDDGSTDKTADYARAYGDELGLKLEVIRRRAPIGKTPTLKRESRELDADVEVILDGDTFLESENYIERLVEELYKAPGIASACGIVQPMRQKDRKAVCDTAPLKDFLDAHQDFAPHPQSLRQRFNRAITNFYRGILYTFLQRFIYRGQMTVFGSIINPVGCAVAYRRKYLKELFDCYEPILGDDLTNSEDIFIGFAMLNEGYRNVQLQDVTVRSLEPEFPRLAHQLYFWSSSFLQSCYYFDGLLRSPFKGLRRYRQKQEAKHYDETHPDSPRHRRRDEPYRQPWGQGHTRQFGRPMGWAVFMSALEKIAFPTALLIMLILQLWEPLLITFLAEMALVIFILMANAPGQRFRAFWEAIAVTPLRYGSLLFDAVNIGRFATDLWITRNRRWRK